MFQTTITLEEFSDLLEELNVASRTDTGWLLVTVGKHPALGSTVAIQEAIGDRLSLVTELPYLTGDHMPLERVLSDEPPAILAAFA